MESCNFHVMGKCIKAVPIQRKYKVLLAASGFAPVFLFLLTTKQYTSAWSKLGQNLGANGQYVAVIALLVIIASISSVISFDDLPHPRLYLFEGFAAFAGVMGLGFSIF